MTQNRKENTYTTPLAQNIEKKEKNLSLWGAWWVYLNKILILKFLPLH
jgi:hypothetical protein